MKPSASWSCSQSPERTGIAVERGILRGHFEVGCIIETFIAIWNKHSRLVTWSQTSVTSPRDPFPSGRILKSYRAIFSRGSFKIQAKRMSVRCTMRFKIASKSRNYRLFAPNNPYNITQIACRTCEVSIAEQRQQGTAATHFLFLPLKLFPYFRTGYLTACRYTLSTGV